MGILTQLSEPASEPLAVSDVHAQLRIDITSEDALIGNLITAARQTVERELNGRVLIDQQWQYTLDHFPVGAIRIPMAPISAITSITYVEPGGTTLTWDPSQYRVDLNSEPVRITPEYLLIYPLTRFVINTVTVTFQAGWADADSVPLAIKQAMLLLIADWYEFRREAQPGVMSKLPTGVDALLSRYRLAIP